MSSLEDSLTDSIRRAKEKIYNQGFTTLAGDSQGESQFSKRTNTFDLRNRAYSYKGEKGGPISKGQESALAGAMKNLQQRIATLEKENHQLSSKSQLSFSSASEVEKQLASQLSKLRESVESKQLELRNLTKENIKLNMKNTELNEKNI